MELWKKEHLSSQLCSLFFQKAALLLEVALRGKQTTCTARRASLAIWVVFHCLAAIFAEEAKFDIVRPQSPLSEDLLDPFELEERARSYIHCGTFAFPNESMPNRELHCLHNPFTSRIEKPNCEKTS